MVSVCGNLTNDLMFDQAMNIDNNRDSKLLWTVGLVNIQRKIVSFNSSILSVENY